MNKRDFTPRQLEAQRLYWRKFKPIFGPVLWFNFCLVWGALIISPIFTRTYFQSAGRLSLDTVMLVTLFAAFTCGGFGFLAHKRGWNAVRRAGLLDESRETIRRTNTTFAGANLSFRAQNRRARDLAFALFLFAVAALMGWFALFFATQIAERILALLGFAFFFLCAVSIFASLNQPDLCLDERGVFSYYLNLWPRLARWNEIESAQFYRWNDFNSGADIGTVTLKNADGQTLLTLNTATFEGAPPGFEKQFIVELKRRLSGSSAG